MYFHRVRVSTKTFHRRQEAKQNRNSETEGKFVDLKEIDGLWEDHRVYFQNKN